MPRQSPPAPSRPRREALDTTVTTGDPAGSGLATAGLALGVAACALIVLNPFLRTPLGLVLALAGLVLSVVAFHRLGQLCAPRRWATAGIIVSAIPLTVTGSTLAVMSLVGESVDGA